MSGNGQPSKAPGSAPANVPDLPTHAMRAAPPENPAGTNTYPFLLPPVEQDELGRLGNYRVLRLLGAGGMGMVFLAEDIALRRRVALKVMKPELEQSDSAWNRFLREARAMAAIKHPHLVVVYQVGQEGQTIYLAMEYLEGETLDDWSRHTGPAAPADVLRIGEELAGGLAAIHKEGLIHRDIKPSNTWLEAPDARVKILDFGLARQTKDDTNLTKSGVLLGTPAYMSPEQARGKPAEARSDLFSLGCVLYRLCAGREPFRSDNTLAQLAALVADHPTPIRELNPRVPPPLADLITQLLAKEPNDRPASAAAVAAQLRQIRQKFSQPRPLPGSGDTEAIVTAPEKSSRQRWPIFALIGLALAAGIIVGIVQFFPPRDNQRSPNPIEKTSSPEVASPSPKAGDTKPVYLTQLTMLDAVNWPMPSPKDGKDDKKGKKKDKGGKKPKQEPFERLSFKGTPAPRGLFLHPSSQFDERVTSVSYRLGKEYSMFHGQASLNDSAADRPSPITLAVYGDGKLLWRSRPIEEQGEPEKCSVSVKGMDVLKLEATADGDVMGAHALWIEPYLIR
jgi:serine/threonine protein kinase